MWTKQPQPAEGSATGRIRQAHPVTAVDGGKKPTNLVHHEAIWQSKEGDKKSLRLAGVFCGLNSLVQRPNDPIGERPAGILSGFFPSLLVFRPAFKINPVVI